ncbi:MAG: hypothetical protein FWE54_01805 [Methanimicrococcus sp.]|nr:hypothetical protein [Methanimicrococcus sp.]
MKKIIFVLLLILIAAVVGAAGCLNGGQDADADNSTNDTVELPPEPEPEKPAGPSSGADIITSFTSTVVAVNPLPEGFTHIATRTVLSHGQGIGIQDALNGYRNMLTYDNSNVYLSVYRCVPPNTADKQIQVMIASHQDKYGNDSKVTTVTINGHDAVLLETTVMDTPQEGRYILVWSNWSGDEYENSYLVVVNGQVNYSVIQMLAQASNL